VQVLTAPLVVLVLRRRQALPARAAT
jgi:hypothetical protein